MAYDMSSLTLSFNKPLMFYNKAKAAPAPTGVMCFNDNEGDLCQMDWNNLPPTQVQANLDQVLGMLPPNQAAVIKRMTDVNQTRADNFDPNLPPQPNGFASPANVIKKLFCNRFNLFGNFSQQTTQPST